MAKTIRWEKEFEHALTLARAENKMVLLDFFQPSLNWLSADGCSYVPQRKGG